MWKARGIWVPALTAVSLAVLTLAPAEVAPPAPQAAPAAVQPAGSDAVVVLTLGDSISNDGLNGGWQAEFCRQLSVSAGKACDLRNAAVPGTTCDYWPSRIASLLAAHQPDLVILACGTNDARLGIPAAAVGTAFRQVVEAVHTWRTPAIPFAPVLIQYSDPLINAPSGPNLTGVALVDREAVVNDALFQNLTLYRPYGWFPGVIDWQIIPAGVPYLHDDGVHPTPAGHRPAGRLAYDHIAPGMGWPASVDPPLCGMAGHRRGYLRPVYSTC